LVLLETLGFTTTGLVSGLMTTVGFWFFFNRITTLSSVFSCDKIASSGIDLLEFV
jgi:hypothetical protein